jgi:hypothetical protein
MAKRSELSEGTINVDNMIFVALFKGETEG